MLIPKLLFLLSSCALPPAAFAQVAPATETPKWQLFLEAGPKTSRFRVSSQGTDNLVPGGFPAGYYRDFKVENTYAAFADVKAFRQLSKRLVGSGSLGLDMQQLDLATTTQQTGPPFRASRGERVVRLLTRVRVDAGLHLALGLGSAGGQLLPGLSIGQMINVSKNGYSHSYVQPELCYLRGNVLVTLRAAVAPYPITLPDVEAISRRDDRAVVERFEYELTEVALGIGIRL